MDSKFQITACCHTDPGLVRSHNEDVCLVDETQHCFLVADGMGGAAAGEVASRIMKETVQELFSQGKVCSDVELKELIRKCFQAANTKILSHVEAEPSHAGMGCTAELLAFGGKKFTLGHVGDSRCYRLRCGEMEQLSRDHTLVQVQLDQGLINPDQADQHSMKNVILRAVGNNKDLDVDIVQGYVLPGDIFLLCSDGLTGMVDDEKILDIMQYDGPLPLKATMLIDQSIDAGGKDNITVVLVEIH